LEITERQPTSPSGWAIALAVLLLAITMISGYRAIGLPPVLIVGGSGLFGMGLWIWSHRQGPLPPESILPPFCSP